MKIVRSSAPVKISRLGDETDLFVNLWLGSFVLNAKSFRCLLKTEHNSCFHWFHCSLVQLLPLPGSLKLETLAQLSSTVFKGQMRNHSPTTIFHAQFELIHIHIIWHTLALLNSLKAWILLSKLDKLYTYLHLRLIWYRYIIFEVKNLQSIGSSSDLLRARWTPFVQF